MSVNKANLTFLLIFALIIFSSANNKAISQSKCYEVDPSNIDETIISILNQYPTRVTIGEQAISDFLNGQLSLRGIDSSLPAPAPYSIGDLTQQINFAWDAVLNDEEFYISSALHLEIANNRVDIPVSRNTTANFPFSPQVGRELWLYSFHTSFGGEQSILSIIIIDKDVSFTCDLGKVLERETIDTEKTTLREMLAPAISPNPIEDQVNIEFELPEEGMVTLQLYDLTGRLVKTPMAQNLLPKGKHQFNFDWIDLPAGSYFCQLHWDGRSYSKMLIKARE